MPKLPFDTAKSIQTVNINQPYKNEINGLTGWLPGYPGIDGTIGVQWLPLITTNGIADPQTIPVQTRFDGPFQPTPALLSSPRLLNIWTALSLPYDNSKLVKVTPGGVLPEMECGDLYWRYKTRVLIVIETNPSVIWTWRGVEQPFAEGEIHIVHHNYKHGVTNNGTTDCIYFFTDIDLTEYQRILG